MVRRLLAISFISAILLVAVPAAADAASLYLSPSSGTYTVGGSFSVTVAVDTGGVAINSAQATVSFPNDILEITSVGQAGIFTLWPISPTYSNATGTVSFAGGVPNPGYTGSGGTIITVTFATKVAGTATVTMGSASILANDGLGTNILTGASGGTYTVRAAAVEPEPEPEPEPDLQFPEAVTITSSSHPEQSLWYSNRDPQFAWNRQDGVVGFSYALDDQDGGTVDQVRDTTDTTGSFAGIGDGIWYFHVRAQNNDGWGPVAQYKILVDGTPPLPFEIELLDGKQTEDRTPQVSFEATDEHSGVHHYVLVINNEPPISIDVGATAPYTLPELAEGKHGITVYAYDFASNSTAAFATFTIGEPPGPVVVDDGEEEAETPAAVRAIDDALRSIEEALPQSVKELIGNIGDVIGNLRDNATVSTIVNDFVEPAVVTTAIVTSAGLIATASAFQITNLAYLFLRFSYFWVAPVHLGRRRRRPWGIVFDSTTGMPVARAIVRIFSREFNKLKESQITDEEGRFGFLIEPDQYYLAVSRSGYIFPSHLLRSVAISQYEDIYRGDTITVTKQNMGGLSINVPIDPNVRTVSQTRLLWLRVINFLGFMLEKFSLPLLIAGTLLSWVTLVLEPKTSNYVILLLYGIFIFLKYMVQQLLERSWGFVEDDTTGDPVDLAIIRIYNTASGLLIGTRVTNQRGQFTALVPPGQYYIVAVKPGYEVFRSKPMMVSKRKGLIRLRVKLKPQTKKPDTTVALEEVVTLEAADTTVSEAPVSPKKRGKGQQPVQAEAEEQPAKPSRSMKKETAARRGAQPLKKPTKRPPAGSPPGTPKTPSVDDLGNLDSQGS
ncbi:MAG: carboxypeptidase regulatory-like domain-containing protein [Patescibacteria group bacterium]